MTSSFGARLRLQREQQQVSLAAIAERTKIRLPLLEGLERDDVKQWPSGIFRRSYLRTYAQAIGLDPEQTVREFLELYPDPAEQADEVLAAAQAVTGTSSLSRRPRTRLQFLFDSALGALPHRRQPGQKPASAPASAFGAGEPHGEPSPGIHADAVPDEAAMVTNVDTSSDGLEADLPMATDIAQAPSGHEAVTQTTDAPEDQRRVEAPVVDVAVDAPDEDIAFHVDLVGVAHLCTRIAQARGLRDVEPLMEDASRLLHAVGVILWMWDANAKVLWPVFSHGYRRELFDRLPDVPADADTAIAAAFRAGETRVVDSGNARTGAVVVPLMTTSGCAGVLALELQSGGERHESVHALATILAAQLSAFTEAPPASHPTTS